MDIFLAASSIFLLRLLDQTLGTLRTLYVNKGKPSFGAVLGFASGTIVGSYIETSIAIGDVVIRIFSPKDQDSQLVAETLRSEGFGVTIISGEGRDGEVSIAWCVAPRKKAKQVLNIVSTINPDAYVTTESTSPINLTSNRK